MKKYLILIIVAIVLMGCTEQPPREFEKQVVTVHQGDTLWSVAGKYSGDTYILEYLETLKSLPENKSVLNPHRFLQPGDKITVINYNADKRWAR